MTRIAVAGASGAIGTLVLREAAQHGLDAVPLDRSHGIDLLTGGGLAEALSGVDAVVDVSQVAALAALGDDAVPELDSHVARYRHNRGVVLDGLAAAGITDVAPADGAFYVYAHVPQFTTALGIGSLELTHRWLDELGVATTSGVDFDLARGHEYVLFSYAGDANDLAEACTLLTDWATRL